MRAPVVLSLHVADSLGEEGIVADAAVLRELDCRPVAVVCGILGVGSGSVELLHPTSPALVARQFEMLAETTPPAAVRTGIFAAPEQVDVVAGLAGDGRLPHLVAAPVVKVRGTCLISDALRDALRERLFPRTDLLVVRAGEAAFWTGHDADGVDGLQRVAAALRDAGAPRVLVAGGIHRGRVVDWLDAEGRVGVLDASRIAAPRIAGLSAAHACALVARLAHGGGLPEAIESAQRYVASRLRRGH